MIPLQHLVIDKTLIEKMISHAESIEEECCGFLLGKDEGDRTICEVVPAKNAAPSRREKQFEIDPLEYLKVEQYAEKKHVEVIGIYHSHPDHPAIPSEHDRTAALPNLSYVILSLMKNKFQGIKSWRLGAQQIFIEEKIINNHN